MSIPVLPFSKVRRVGDLVFLAGEMPFAEDGSIPEGIVPQTDLTLMRIAATLKSEGLSLKDVLSCTVHLVDKADFRAFNEAYARHFSDPLPVRTTVQAELMVDARIEITAIARANG
jgi:enamine deaminase RidA (YjgF/YER057c/UK114 family)